MGREERGYGIVENEEPQKRGTRAHIQIEDAIGVNDPL